MKMYVSFFLATFLGLTMATYDQNQTSSSCCCKCNNRSQLNIIYILADDLGWNEVSAHGNNQACTPNIDALMMIGERFGKFYTHPQCTPSRTALMSGRYAEKLGMEYMVIAGSESRCVPLNVTFLPQYLQREGYTTHHIGKWHLGSCKNACRPLQRGFNTSLGFWLGKTDYFGCNYKELYSLTNPTKVFHGFNCYKGNEPCYNKTGEYLTDVFTEEAVKIIKSKNCSSKPFFLYLAHPAIHAANDYDPMQSKWEDKIKFSDCLKDKGRVDLTAMTYALDRSVGRIFQVLNDTGLICNTLVIFTSDNGGTQSILEYTNGTNCPLRGAKMTAWEAGCKVPAAIWNPCLNVSLQGKTYNGYFHMVDWMKTLVCGVAKGNCSMFKDFDLDSKNLWPAINKHKPKRKSLICINDPYGLGIASYIQGNWKLVCNGSYPAVRQNCMCGMCGRDARQCTFCNETLTATSTVARVLSPLLNKTLTEEMVKEKRKEYTIRCNSTILPDQTCINCSCLFYIKKDPCENVNLGEIYKEKRQELIDALNSHIVKKPLNKPPDSRCDPKYYDCTWTNWCDINNVPIN